MVDLALGDKDGNSSGYNPFSFWRRASTRVR